MEESKYPESDKLTYLHSWTDLLNLIEYMDSKGYIKVDAPKAPVEIVYDYLGIDPIALEKEYREMFHGL